MRVLRVQGRVRTKTVKKAAKQIVETYYQRLTLDFHTNKRLTEEIASIPTKRMRNKIAGFATHLMKRIQKGPVPGISLKLQEQERERKMDLVPEQSALDTDDIPVDEDTNDMLRRLNLKLPGVHADPSVAPPPAGPVRQPAGARR
jgi:small subunit ribosomal protein S17e